jgi:hypothetical protein
MGEIRTLFRAAWGNGSLNNEAVAGKRAGAVGAWQRVVSKASQFRQVGVR